jgi:glycosyltransferase involved in cell wall biosynthesis
MAPSEWQRQRLARDGLPPRQIIVVPSPVEAGHIAGVTGARVQPPIILFAARLVRFKGAHHLLQAVARLGLDVQVQLAGDGPETEPLKRCAERLGIADQVTFLGSLSPDELRERYRQATVVAVPSLFPETFNRTGPEALASGTPVVAYASGGVGEWLRAGVTGISVPVGDVPTFADALREVITGRVLSESVRRRGPEVAAEFSVRRHAERVAACYEAALGQSKIGAE